MAASDVGAAISGLQYVFTNATAPLNRWACVIPQTASANSTNTSDGAWETGTVITNRAWIAGAANSPIDGGHLPNYLILGYIESTDCKFPNNNHASTTAPAYYRNTDTTEPQYCMCISPLGFYLAGAIFSERYSIATADYANLQTRSMAGFQFANSVKITGAQVTGVKANFFKATTLAAAFDDPMDMRTNFRVGGLSNFHGVLFNIGDGQTYRTGRLIQPTQLGTIIWNDAAVSAPLSSLWTDAIDPAKSYGYLWSTYPDLMPTVAQTVYTIRELPTQTLNLASVKTSLDTTGTSLGTLNTTLGTVKTSLDTGNTATSGITTALGTVNTSVVSIRTGIDNEVTQMTTTNTALAGMGNNLQNAALGANALATAVGGIGTTLTSQQSALMDLDTHVTASISALGSSFSGFLPDPAHVTSILAIVANGGSREDIVAAFPQESFQFAQDIDVLLSMSSAAKLAAFNSMLQAMQAGTSLYEQITTNPHILELTSADLVNLDRLFKTGMYP